jgi:AcrR family transcriptional regulator
MGTRSAAERETVGSTRDRLIAAALELIRDGGEDALSMRALGDLSGLSRGAPYRHFQDKDALLQAIATAGLIDLGRRTDRATARARGSRLSAALRAYVSWAIDNPDWYRVTFQSQATGHGTDVDHELSAAAGEVMVSFSCLVTDAQALGELPAGPPEELVGVLWAATHGAIDLSLAGHGKPHLGTADPRRLVDSLLGLLRPR